MSWIPSFYHFSWRRHNQQVLEVNVASLTKATDQNRGRGLCAHHTNFKRFTMYVMRLHGIPNEIR